MSEFLLTKTHIDAIMTAAFQWADPEGFRYSAGERQAPRLLQSEQADQFGALLWQANFQAVFDGVSQAELLSALGSETLPPYHFEALRGVADPLTVLKVVACYSYQTSGGPAGWDGTDVQAFIAALENAAVGRIISEHSEIPWALSDDDRDIFATGAGPLPTETDWSDPLWPDIDRRLTATGIPFRAQPRGAWTALGGDFPSAEMRGQWFARAPREPSTPAISVTLLASEAAAQRAFDSALADEREHRQFEPERILMRSGRVIIRYRQQYDKAAPPEWVQAMEAMFGPGDQRWAQLEQTRAVTGARVLAERLILNREPPDRPGGIALLAQDRASLRRLCDLIADEGVRQQVAATNTDMATVILLTRIPRVVARGSGEVVGQGQLATEDRPASTLWLNVEDVKNSCACVLAVDRLPDIPTVVNLRDHAHGLPAYPAEPD